MTQNIPPPQGMDEDTIFELTEIVYAEGAEEKEVQSFNLPEKTASEDTIFLEDQDVELIDDYEDEDEDENENEKDSEYNPRLEDLIDTLAPPDAEGDETSEESIDDFDSMLDDLLDEKTSPDEPAMSIADPTDEQEQEDPTSEEASSALDYIDLDNFPAHAELASFLTEKSPKSDTNDLNDFSEKPPLNIDTIRLSDLQKENSLNLDTIDLDNLLEEEFLKSDEFSNEEPEVATTATLSNDKSSHETLSVSALLAAAERELNQFGSEEVTPKRLTTLTTIQESLNAITARLDSFNAYFLAENKPELQNQEIPTDNDLTLSVDLQESLDSLSERLDALEARFVDFDMESITKQIMQQMQADIEKAAAAAAASILREEIQVLFNTMAGEEAPTDNNQ